MKTKSSKRKKIQKKEKIGFFKRIFGGGDPAQRRAIRLLKKELAQVKIDIYKIKHDLILTPIAKILYEVYKLTYPFKQFFVLDSSTKRFPPSFDEDFVLYFHSKEAIDLYDKLTEEYINKLITKYGIKKTITHINNLLKEYFEYFDTEKIKNINFIYSNFLGFARFSKFDFFPILREFDPHLEEGNFTKKPSFSPAEGTFLRNDMYKLHKALYMFDFDNRLDQGMEIFSQIKSFEPISSSNFNKLKNMIGDLQKNNYFALIIRAIDKNIAPVPIEKPPTVPVYNSFSYKRRGDINAILNSIKNKIKEDSVSSIVSQLFEDNASKRIKNYNESKNDQFKNLGLPVFQYVKPLNYAKAFITDKYKAFINRVVNELIVSGIFINKGILNDLSNSYYALNSHLHNITQFDNELDTDSSSGKTIKRLLFTVKKDKGARKVLEKTIYGINTKAKVIIDEELVNMKQMAVCLKNILEDYKEKNPVTVSNIKKIRSNYNKQFIEELLSAYKDIYLFLKLLSNYVSITISRSEIEKRKNSIKE